MQVSGMGMQQMHRYGASQGNGQNGQMREIMQSLSPEDRESVRSQMQSLSKTERQNLVDQIKQLDYANMDSSQLTQSIMDLIGGSTQTQTTSYDSSILSMYA